MLGSASLTPDWLCQSLYGQGTSGAEVEYRYDTRCALFRWFLPANLKTLLPHRDLGRMGRCVPPRHVRGLSCPFGHLRRGLRLLLAPIPGLCVFAPKPAPAPPRHDASWCIRRWNESDDSRGGKSGDEGGKFILRGGGGAGRLTKWVSRNQIGQTHRILGEKHASINKGSDEIANQF